jgi:putative membrane protein (TIGR04086 family)
VLAGLLVIALFLAGFSLLIGNTDVSEELVQAMACIALCAGSFTAGFVAAKKRRQKGLLVGLLCGIVMYFVVLIIGLFLLQSASAAGTAAKLIVMILCSCIGGVVGVNTRCKKPECQ